MSWVKYPHIGHLISSRPRAFLAKNLLWTYKRDGHCMSMWEKRTKKQKEIILSSHGLAIAQPDLKNLVESIPESINIVNLVISNPMLHPFFELCRKGRSITGAELYDRARVFVFDIFSTKDNKFLPYNSVKELCDKWKIPIVKLFSKTKHSSVKDLLKYSHYIIEQCKFLNLEGMVIKTNPHRVIHPRYNPDYLPPVKAYLQAKVKIHIPLVNVKKIARGETIHPQIPESEVMGAIDKVWQELGTEKFKEVRLAMPLVARYVGIECKKHFFSMPPNKLFLYYQGYIERHLSGRKYV